MGIRVCVDVVTVTVVASRAKVLLVKRVEAPHRARWALPGDFVKADESLDDAARRVVCALTRLKSPYLEQMYTFGKPRRVPGARVIAVAYLAAVRCDDLEVDIAHDVRSRKWAHIAAISRLAFDHHEMVKAARARMGSSPATERLAFQLLPETFTFADAQGVFEALLGERLDTRNFRRRLAAFGTLEESGSVRLEGRHRPARLYRLNA